MLSSERAGAVVHLVLDRPERRNALHPEQLEALADAVERLGEDPTVSLVTLRGAGDAAFSSGFDLDVLAAAGDAPEPPSVKLFATVQALVACPVPTLAIVRGYCFGAGFDLAMACDFRIGSPDARFAVPAVRIGTVYEPRSIDRIQRLLGPTVAKELFVTGRELSAARAAQVGILQEVVEGEQLEEAIARWESPGPEQARSHKQIIDRLAAAPERGDGFWGPLDALRERSLRGSERRRALAARSAR